MQQNEHQRVRTESALHFVNQGARVRVCANTPHALELAERVLPVGSRIEPFNSPDALFALVVSSGDAAHRLYHDSALLESSHDLEAVLGHLESELHFAVACHARASLFVHAGVVGWRDRTILLPGRSMSGKTSLVAALVRAGAEYYSDEYAVIDQNGRVHPYAKPLGLRLPWGAGRPPAPDSSGGRVGRRSLRASLIVSTHYAKGARFEPEERRPGRGLMILIANTVVIRDRPRFALDHLTRIAGEATTLQGVRGDADDAAVWLLRCWGAERPTSLPDASSIRGL